MSKAIGIRVKEIKAISEVLLRSENLKVLQYYNIVNFMRDTETA